MLVSKRLVLDELRKAFNGTYSAVDSLDGKLQNMLNYSSVIISVISVILTVASKLPQGTSVGEWYWVFLFLSILLYFIMFVRIRMKLLPISTAFPISRNMKTLEEKYFDPRFGEERVLDQAILDYLHYIEVTSKIVDVKAKEVGYSSVLMFLIIVFLICTALFGLVFPTL